MVCGNVLDERMVSFLFSYEFEECFLTYTFRQNLTGTQYFFKNKFLLFLKDERREKDATYPL